MQSEPKHTEISKLDRGKVYLSAMQEDERAHAFPKPSALRIFSRGIFKVENKHMDTKGRRMGWTEIDIYILLILCLK